MHPRVGHIDVGTAGDDHAPCMDNAQNCANDIYAVSLAGVTPAAYITAFQAQEACANARKRLPTSAEWQVAANGTPDAGPDNGTTDGNNGSTLAVAGTGSRSSCVAARGAFDMVGNLPQRVADWVKVIDCCRHSAAASGAAPTLRAITNGAGITTKEMFALFPKGPAKKVARSSGLGKPEGCV